MTSTEIIFSNLLPMQAPARQYNNFFSLVLYSLLKDESTMELVLLLIRVVHMQNHLEILIRLSFNKNMLRAKTSLECELTSFIGSPPWKCVNMK